MTLRLLAPALVLFATPALAERIPPLAPAPGFDSLAVPMPPMPAPPAPPRIEGPKPPVVIPPGPPGVPVVIVPAQAPAEETPSDLFGRGMEAMLDNVLREMEPTFQGMARGLDQARTTFGPALDDLGTLIDDIGNYQAPERLANGDILIRRRADAPPAPPVGEALRDLTTPRDGTTTPPATAPDFGATPTPVPPTAVPPAGDPPALARPIPAVPPGSQIDL